MAKFFSINETVPASISRSEIIGLSQETTGGPGEPLTAPGFIGQYFPLPTYIYKIIVNAPRMSLDGSPGVEINRRIRRGASIPVGPTYASLQYPNNIVEQDVNELMAQIDVTNDSTITNTRSWVTRWHVSASGIGGKVFTTIVYDVPSEPTLSWFTGSDIAISISATPKNSKFHFMFFGTSPVNQNQEIIASDGKLKYISIVWSHLSAGTTAKLTLQHEVSSGLGDPSGSPVDTPFSYTLSGGGTTRQGILDVVTEHNVSAGDFLNYSVVRLSGTGTSIWLFVTIGFIPS